ncbi:MAG: TonB-dependent receptor [Bacteroidales bacterium]|nr:TonB-dependent receptor [Bacteroidales bacterium]
MSQVQNLSGYSFVYESGDLDVTKTVSVHATTLQDAVSQIVKGQDVSFTIRDRSIIISKNASAVKSGKKITGTILDENGEPVIGAAVMVKGSSVGAITDLDGRYSLEASPEATLVVSCVGYADMEFSAASIPSEISLSVDSQFLDEVVVVGYGVQRKSSVTGAIASVKSEDFENRTASNPLQALQGKTAGVNIVSGSAAPGASATVQIRGISSNGSSQPLYVVDGRIASDINGLDPGDIESMEVLKDAASAAIYGAQAGNGVILVTTKKGKGEGTVSYNVQLTAQMVARTPKVMNSEQYIDYYTEKGNFSLDDVYANWDFKTNTDWSKVAFETSFMQRHNVTFSSGNEKGNIYVSGSYLDNDGIVVGDADKYQRFTGMINAEYNIKSWLSIGVNTQIEYYKSRFISEYNNSGIYGNMFLGILQLDPLTRPTYTEDELPRNMRSILDGYRAGKNGELLSDGNGNYYGVSSFSSSDNLNPYILRDKAFNSNQGHSLNGVAYVNLTPVKGLTFTSRLGYSLGGAESRGVDFDYYANAQAFQNHLSVSASSSNPSSYMWENFVNYYKSFGKHNLSLMAGTSYSQARSYGVDGRYHGSDGDLGFLQDDPLFWYFAYATPTAVREVGGGEARYTRKNSYFGRLSWDYADKYFLQVSMRADAADLSVLPKPRRWGYFPSVSAGWVISNESFMENTRTWLSHLKLRASWGQNGSTASLGNYSWLTSIQSTGNYPFTNGLSYVTGYAPTSTGNEELKWETSEQLDLGVDARFLSNRLTLGVDYFLKNTRDLIVSGITPSTVVGNTSSPINAGNIRNSGIEIDLGWQDRVGEVDYSVRGNLATVKNRVTFLHPSLSEGINGTNYPGYATITKFEVGHPAWYYYGYEYTGVDPLTGDPTFRDIDGNGSIGDNDKTEIGKSIPDFTYGITLTAAWKGFDAIVFGSGSYGNDIFCGLNREDYAINKLTYFTSDRWSSSNTSAKNPRASANDLSKYAVSSANVFDGSYFKIKQIQLGYSLPSSILSKTPLSSVRAYLSLEDWFTFTRYIGFDPEITTIDMGSYPTSKKVVFGLNVSF